MLKYNSNFGIKRKNGKLNKNNMYNLYILPYLPTENIVLY